MRTRLALIHQNPLIPFVFQAAAAEDIDVVYFHRPGATVPPDLPAVVGAVPLDIFGDREGSLAQVEKLHQRERLAGALTLFELAVPFTAEVTERLGLPGIGRSVARRCRDKWLQRQAFRTAGLNCPRFLQVDNADDVEAAVSGLRFPVVLKPTNGRSSQGVIRADDVDEVRAAAKLVAAIIAEELAGVADPSREERSSILVEEYLDGPEFCVEGFTDGGDRHLLAVAYKGNATGPFFEEGVYITPPELPQAVVDDIHREVLAGHEALGIPAGATHSELRLLDGNTPVLLEIGARMGGSGVVHHQVHASTGVDFARLVVRQAVARANPVEAIWPRPAPRRTAADWIVPLAGSGRFLGLSGIDDVRRHPDTDMVLEMLQPGDEVPAFPRFQGYPAFVLSSHDDFESCVAYHEYLAATLHAQWDTAREDG